MKFEPFNEDGVSNRRNFNILMKLDLVGAKLSFRQGSQLRLQGVDVY